MVILSTAEEKGGDTAFAGSGSRAPCVRKQQRTSSFTLVLHHCQSTTDTQDTI